MSTSQACAKCGKAEIYNKARRLCRKCYTNLRSAGELDLRHYQREHLHTYSICAAEAEYASRYLKPGWIAQPATFRLGGRERYTPDFWDPHRQAFIELSATKQAYHANKQKYLDFRSLYPGITLLIVDTEDNELFAGSRVSWPRTNST